MAYLRYLRASDFRSTVKDGNISQVVCSVNDLLYDFFLIFVRSVFDLPVDRSHTVLLQEAVRL